jgi:GT2 family glycosyltransferase
MKYLFALISHGSTNDLVESLQSLYASIHNSGTRASAYQVLVVENKLSFYDREQFFGLANTDGSFPKVIYTSNNGYNAAINVALNYARKFCYDFLIVGNPDVIFEYDYVENLVSCCLRQSFWLAVPNVLNKPGMIKQNPRQICFEYKKWLFKMKLYIASYASFCLVNFWRRIKLKYTCISFFAQNRNDSALSLSPVSCDVVSGVQFIFNLQLLPTNFCLDEQIFLWGEELALLFLLRNYNQRPLFLPAPTVIHKVSTAVQLIDSFDYFLIQKQSINRLISTWHLLKNRQP